MALACGALAPATRALAQTCGAAGGDTRPESVRCGDHAPAEPASQPQSEPATGTANSVDLVTGNKYVREVDAAWPGRLVLARHYNSRNAFGRTLGTAWSHSYDTVLARVKTRRGGDELQVIQGDGRRLVFVPLATKSPVARYRGSHGVHGTITRHDDVSADRRYAWRWPDARVVHFRDDGRLSAIAFANGDRLELGYDDAGRLRRVENRWGHRFEFEYHRDKRAGAYPGRLAAVVQPDGHRLVYRYDERGLLESATDPDGVVRTYRYDDPYTLHALTRIDDGAQRAAGTYAYDAQMRAVRSALADDRQAIELAWTVPATPGALGQTRVRRADGATTVYRWRYAPHAHRAWIVSARGPGCAACPESDVERSFDAAGRLVQSRHSRDGTIERLHYDAQGRLASRSVAARTVRYAYAGPSPDAPLAEVQVDSIAPGRRHGWRIDRDAEGRPTRITEYGHAPALDSLDARLRAQRWHAIERTWRYTWHETGVAAGRLASIDGPLPGDGDTTRFEYDARGLARAVHRPEGLVERIEHDAYARIARWVEATGADTRIDYTRAGRVSAITRDGRRTEVRWPAPGRIEWHVDGRPRLAMSLDGAGVPSEVTDALGRRARFTRDADGDVRSVDVYGGDPDRVALHLEPPGAPPSPAAPWSPIAESHGRTRWVDGLGRASWALVDDFGHRVAEITPAAGVTLHRYDAAGRRIATIDAAGSVTLYRRDALGRVVAAGSPDDPLAIQRRYEGARLLWESDPWQTRAWTYDARARVMAEAVLIGERRRAAERGHPYVTTFGYDASGRLAWQAVSGGYAIGFGYDASGEVAAIAHASAGAPATMLALQIERLPFAAHGTALAGIVLGNGVAVRYEHDARGRMSAIMLTRRDGVGGDLPRLVLGRDADGRVVSIERDREHERYAYDAGGRLTHADTAELVERFAYDPDGNRLAWWRRPPEGPDAEAQAERYRYDARGRLVRIERAGPGAIASESRDYTPTGVLLAQRAIPVDAARESLTVHVPTRGGRPAALVRDRNVLARYAYNAHGERIAWRGSDARASRQFVYRSGRLEAVLDAQGDVQQWHVALSGRPLAILDVTPTRQVEVRWPYVDQASTVRAHTDRNAQYVRARRATAFGVPSSSRGSGSGGEAPTLFDGQLADPDTDLRDHHLRTYDPSTGRFVSPDPLGPLAGPNPYLYAGADPIGQSDPSGLYQTDVHYYMTFYLARVAGLGYSQALTIAQATQYVDDDPATGPLPNWHRRLDRQPDVLRDFHFTQYGADPPRMPGESGPDYAMRRVANPRNGRLDALLAFANEGIGVPGGGSGVSPCVRAWRFGVFLHAFEDTFSHRDPQNAPIGVNGGLGHLGYDANPDYTYNHVTPLRAWLLNEQRTLRMEFEAFRLFQTQFGTVAHDADGFPIEFPDIEQTLREFNATREEDCSNARGCWPRKIALLDASLARLGLGHVPVYSVERAREQARGDASHQ